jgi:flagella basal body P-ring formation protein FlgA
VTVALGAFGPRAAAGEVYRLKEEVVLNQPLITLKDLLDPAPDGGLAQVSVGRLGKPGNVRLVGRDVVIQRMAGYLKAPAPEVQGSLCRVVASNRWIAGVDLVRFGHQSIVKNLEGLSGTAAVEIQDPAAPMALRVWDKPVVLSIDSRTGPWRGRIILTVQAQQKDSDGKMEVQAYSSLSYLVKVQEGVLVATRSVGRGETVGPENAELSQQDVTYQLEDGFSDMAAAFGQTARRAIPQGSVLVPSMLELPWAVKRGDPVKLRVKAGGVKIEASAQALKDGRKGDLIPVQILDTKKRVDGVVLENGLVQATAP